MSQLPNFRRFIIQDYPGAPQWVDRMFGPLNLFCEQTVASLNKGLALNANVQGQAYSVSFTTPANYASGGFTPIVLNYVGGGQPSCLLLGRIIRNDGTLITTPVTVTGWNLNLNTNPYQVNVTYVAGLAASTQYNMNFIVM